MLQAEANSQEPPRDAADIKATLQACKAYLLRRRGRGRPGNAEGVHSMHRLVKELASTAGGLHVCCCSAVPRIATLPGDLSRAPHSVHISPRTHKYLLCAADHTVLFQPDHICLRFFIASIYVQS